MMDTQDSHHSQAQFHHGQPPQPGPNMMAAPPHQSSSYGIPNNAMMQQSHQSLQQQQQQQNPRFPFNSIMGGAGSGQPPAGVDYPDGSSPRTSGFGIEPTKKKRGRPRKYSPDGGIALGLTPTPVSPISSMAGHGDSGGGSGTNNSAQNHSSENQPKKARGRPPGPGKRQMDAFGSTGIGFTPHVITVQAGEDVAKKITTFSQQGPRTVCILSASGSICNVTLRQPATCGGTVTLEGRFEIITLSGSFSPSEGNVSRTCGLSVSLAGADGKVVGGGIAGMLTAAGPVQVIVGSFIADGKKPKYKRSSLSSTPPSSNIMGGGCGGPPLAMGASPPSEDDGSSESSSDENGGSPLNHHGPPSYGNNPTQPVQTMPVYGNMSWHNSTM
ncbi:hypothetical protein DM860_014922 [Cuscuta australis]|uniref:AT-hook motif nuclear-localized protein n=1 Tax=Cuscuta australis TaxID=267555 RepID=A0A328E2E6_9ASTE|nr:hypothetical protein DM860_014922 [Cuscuta australis]